MYIDFGNIAKMGDGYFVFVLATSHSDSAFMSVMFRAYPDILSKDRKPFTGEFLRKINGVGLTREFHHRILDLYSEIMEIKFSFPSKLLTVNGIECRDFHLTDDPLSANQFLKKIIIDGKEWVLVERTKFQPYPGTYAERFDVTVYYVLKSFLID